MKIEDIPEDLYNQIADKAYDLGHVSAAQSVATAFKERAGQAFSRGDDKEAYVFRQLSEEYEKKAKTMRSTYDVKYPQP